MERRIQETDSNGVALKSLIESLEVALLHRFDLVESGFSLLNCIGADHLTECSDTVSLKEHMLCTAETDALCAKLAGFLSVLGSISVCSYLKLSVLVSPSHDPAELACNLSVNGSDLTVVNVTCGAVD